MLMLAVLSIGILTALTATGMPQVQPVFAEKEECNDNDDKNCNKKEIEQKNNCEIEVDKSDNSGGTSQKNGGLSTDCLNFAANPDDVEEQAQVGQDQTLEPRDTIFGELP